MSRLLAVFLTLLCLAAPAWAQKRHALVIGNDAYPGLPANQQLRKAVNDARAMETTLRELGFAVKLLTDATRDQINVALDRLESAVEGGDTVFLFFSGHGIEIDNANFLLPADIRVRDGAGNPVSKRTMQGEAFNAAKLVSDLKQRGAKTVIAVFDACRDAPFEANVTRNLGTTRGLARMEPPSGVFVLFSAGAKQRAVDRLTDDDPNPNSVFTRVFVPLLRQPGLSLIDIAKKLQPEVRELAARVGEEQVPAYYDEIVGQFILVPASTQQLLVTPDDGAAEKLLREQRETLEAEAERRRRAMLEETERLRRQATEEVDRQRREMDRLRREATEQAERLRREAEQQILRHRLESERLQREATERADQQRRDAERVQREAAEQAERRRREAEARAETERKAAEWEAERGRRFAEVAALKRGRVDPATQFELHVCNKSTKAASVAVSHYLRASDKWVVEGWWKVEVGKCEFLGRFRRGEFYSHAVAPDGTTWGKDFKLCVEKLRFARVNAGKYSCSPQEELREFTSRKIDTAKFTWNLNP